MQRVFEALSFMRTHDWSLTRAAQEAGTTLRTLRKYAGTAIVRTPTGRYEVKSSDRLQRHMRLPTPEGLVALDIRGSRTASLVGRYWNMLDAFLRTGRTDALREFRHKSIGAGRSKYTFVTDPRILRRLALAGEVSFEDLYALVQR